MSPKVADVAACPHCGTAVEGAEDRFCCAGCALASELIRGAGLEAYYREREALPSRPRVDDTGWETVPVEPLPDGGCQVRLQVDGLRCASCVWVTEGVLERTDGVRSVRVSYATGRTTLRWDPEQVALPELVRRIQHLGYRPRLLGEAERPDRSLLLRLGVAAFVAMNVMLLHVSLYAGWMDGMEPRFVALFRWASLVLTTPVALWAAAPFFAGAWAGLRRGFLHMDLPIALAVAVLYGHAVVMTVTGAGESYLDSLAMLVALLLAGRVLEGHGRRRAADAATSLASQLPSTGRRIRRDGGTETVAAESLAAGDRLAVGMGEEFAADGVVRTGGGRVVTALVTGESEPRSVAPGEEVFGGTVLLEGAVEVEVTAAGAESTVRRMAEELRDAAARPAAPGSADRIAPWFTLATLVVAALTLVGWTALAGWGPAVTATVAVLVVACPCALALAGPLTGAAGLGAAARRGLLLRSPDALARLAGVDTVVLDKTGTVTRGLMTVVAADDEALRIAAGLERFSVHPVAGPIVEEAVARGLPLPHAREVRELPGVGVSGWIDGVECHVRGGGPGELQVLRGDRPVGGIRMGDVVRPEAREAVAGLRDMGLEVLLRTGDHESVARRVAGEAGIADWAATRRPEAKAAEVRSIQERGGRVLFAGDGVNDGPALAAAHAGVAMGTGSASSILVADGVVGADSLAPLVAGIRVAREARRTIRASQARSLVYNVLAVALAAAGWVNPLVAAVLMPLSSGLVVAGAAGLERRVARPEGGAGQGGHVPQSGKPGDAPGTAATPEPADPSRDGSPLESAA